MAEIGLAASIIQVAATGITLSKALYEYADSVASSDIRIKAIAQQVKLTSTVIKELEGIFGDSAVAQIVSKDAIITAQESINSCSSLFREISGTVDKRKGKVGKLIFPFKETKLALYGADLERVKSNLQLLMHVLIHAQLLSNSEDKALINAQRAEIEGLIKLRDGALKEYENSKKDFDKASSRENQAISNRIPLVGRNTPPTLDEAHILPLLTPQQRDLPGMSHSDTQNESHLGRSLNSDEHSSSLPFISLARMKMPEDVQQPPGSWYPPPSYNQDLQNRADEGLTRLQVSVESKGLATRDLGRRHTKMVHFQEDSTSGKYDYESDSSTENYSLYKVIVAEHLDEKKRINRKEIDGCLTQLKSLIGQIEYLQGMIDEGFTERSVRRRGAYIADEWHFAKHVVNEAFVREPSAHRFYARTNQPPPPMKLRDISNVISGGGGTRTASASASGELGFEKSPKIYPSHLPPAIPQRWRSPTLPQAVAGSSQEKERRRRARLEALTHQLSQASWIDAALLRENHTIEFDRGRQHQVTEQKPRRQTRHRHVATYRNDGENNDASIRPTLRNRQNSAPVEPNRILFNRDATTEDLGKQRIPHSWQRDLGLHHDGSYSDSELFDSARRDLLIEHLQGADSKGRSDRYDNGSDQSARSLHPRGVSFIAAAAAAAAAASPAEAYRTRKREGPVMLAFANVERGCGEQTGPVWIAG
ncbi:hypothetical protein NA57DRAFT_56159 [Rhizodiscina lignyota]|uniref:Fungal N-terminal domain-containing protein n=1 Tax=Rhizodiscina lignyota TaxID=1504668 RepID=A0A9P4IEE7_9PEZI|nr:hypothetical protein NA57DRAFT_56159 [Rhizodiscina lignyota]